MFLFIVGYLCISLSQSVMSVFVTINDVQGAAKSIREDFFTFSQQWFSISL